MKLHSKSTYLWRALAFTSGITALLFGCSHHSSDPSQDIVRELPPSQVLLKFRGGTIKAGDVHDQIQPKLEKLRDDTVSLYRHEAEALALDRVLEARAQAQGFKNASEFKDSLRAKIEISDSMVTDFIKRNHLAASSKDEAKKFMQNQAWLTKQEELKQSLLKDADLAWQITDAVHEFQESGAIAPRGASDAKIIIQEYCDFSNPLCSSVRVGMEQIFARFPKEVSILFHPIARNDRAESLAGAIAAICSAQQGKFWEMQNKLLDHQEKLNTETIQGISKEIGLDAKRFQSCLSDSKTQSLINDEQLKAKSHGVTETPALFVNGERVDSIDALSAKVAALAASHH